MLFVPICLSGRMPAPGMQGRRVIVRAAPPTVKVCRERLLDQPVDEVHALALRSGLVNKLHAAHVRACQGVKGASGCGVGGWVVVVCVCVWGGGGLFVS